MKPTFKGKAEADSSVEIFDGSESLGTAEADQGTADSDGNKEWSFTVPADSALGSGVHPITAEATDAANNTSDPSGELKVTIDKDAPQISFSSGITDLGEYYYGDVPPEPTCTAKEEEDGSGVDGSCTVSGYKTDVGPQTLTGKAKDVAGNEGTAQLSYTVLAWTLSGFRSPVDMNYKDQSGQLVKKINTVKNGSTVPLKFEVFKGTTELTDTGLINTPLTAKQVNCTTGQEDAVEQLASSGSTALRYDTTGGQFIYNWQTPKKAGACYDVSVSTQDGSTIPVAHFNLK